jgi:hypothetical protein
MWCKASKRFVQLQRQSVAADFLDLPKERVSDIRAFAKASEIELQALHVLAQDPAQQNVANQPGSVRDAVNRLLQRRRQEQRQMCQWLREDLEGPLLGTGTRFSG